VKKRLAKQDYLFCKVCPHFKAVHGARGCTIKGCECKEKKTNG
jgi:hypothetical protein